MSKIKITLLVFPLVLVNGMMLKNHEKLFELQATNIENINVVVDKYIVGPHIFQGILDITMFDEINPAFFGDDFNLNRYELMKPLAKKKYFNQLYAENSDGMPTRKIPDYRRQLYWNSHVSIEKNTSIDFFTSDVTGEFEIVLEGFTSYGKPISLKKTFSVVQ